MNWWIQYCFVLCHAPTGKFQSLSTYIRFFCFLNIKQNNLPLPSTGGLGCLRCVIQGLFLFCDWWTERASHGDLSQNQGRDGVARWGGVLVEQPRAWSRGGLLMNLASSAVHVDRFRKSREEFWTTCTIMSGGWFSVLSKHWNHQRAFKKGIWVPSPQSLISLAFAETWPLRFFKLPRRFSCLARAENDGVAFWEEISAESYRQGPWQEPGE